MQLCIALVWSLLKGGVCIFAQCPLLPFAEEFYLLRRGFLIQNGHLWFKIFYRAFQNYKQAIVQFLQCPTNRYSVLLVDDGT